MGSLRDLSKSISKQGVGKGKSSSLRGGGFKGVTTHDPENFNGTFIRTLQLRIRSFAFSLLNVLILYYLGLRLKKS